jgi:hypothetical protein
VRPVIEERVDRVVHGEEHRHGWVLVARPQVAACDRDSHPPQHRRGGPPPAFASYADWENWVERLVSIGERASAERLAGAWRAAVEAWSFDEVNDLIWRHNRWYPVEARLPMDPRRRDYVLVNGRDYRLRPLDAEWALARYPAAA